MAKVKINYSLKNKEKTDKNIKGILKNNHLIFNDENNHIDIEIFDNSIILKRENNESLNEMIFSEKSSCKYFLKQYNKYVTFDIELLKLVINDNSIEIIYKIEEEIIEFKLSYEVI